MYDLSPDSDPDGKFSIDPQVGYLSNVKTFDDMQDVELPIKLKVTARDSPDLTSRALTESTYVYVSAPQLAFPFHSARQTSPLYEHIQHFVILHFFRRELLKSSEVFHTFLLLRSYPFMGKKEKL